MDKMKATLLLILTGIILLPWQLLCVEHPTGHDHHQHDGPSPCDLHRKYAAMSGEHLFAPMECEHVTPDTDDFQPSFQLKLLTVDQFSLVAVLLNLLPGEIQGQAFYPLPDPYSNSDPPLGVNALRGPPFV